jgi:hypothetical protein
MLLEPDVRASQSAWGFIPPEAADRAVDRLRGELRSGAWDERFGHLRYQSTFEGSLRLIVADIE